MRSLFLIGRRVSLAVLAGVAVIALLVLITTRVLAFIHIFTPHSGIALTQDEVNAAHNATTPDPRPQVVPKIIHQIFHNWKDPGNKTVPADWEAQRQSCVRLNPDWEYILWDEMESQLFIANEYPHFLATYDGYRYPVQRVDALRYFLMRHYGGIYMDLDNGCSEGLDPLLYYPLWVTDGGHGTLSNNILGAVPGHPFWVAVTEALPDYAWHYILPYITIHYASGQWFMTAIWEQYHARLGRSHHPPSSSAAAAAAAFAVRSKRKANRADGEADVDLDAPLTRIMMDMREGAARWVFFTMGRGESWRNWDNDVFRVIGEKLVFVLLGAGALAVVVLWLCSRCCGWRLPRLRRGGDGRRGRYTSLRDEPAGEELDDVGGSSSDIPRAS